MLLLHRAFSPLILLEAVLALAPEVMEMVLVPNDHLLVPVTAFFAALRSVVDHVPWAFVVGRRLVEAEGFVSLSVSWAPLILYARASLNTSSLGRLVF